MVSSFQCSVLFCLSCRTSPGFPSENDITRIKPVYLGLLRGVGPDGGYCGSVWYGTATTKNEKYGNLPGLKIERSIISYLVFLLSSG